MVLDLDNGGGPVYERIGKRLEAQIRSGRLQPGEYLPTETDLATDLGVSVGTIKKALARLASEGLIERRRGHGTVVVFPGRDRAIPRRRSVLVLLGEVTRSFFAEIYSGIRAELNRRDCDPILHESWTDPGTERRLLEEYSSAMAGAIIGPCSGAENYPIYGRLLAAGIPFVFVDRYLTKLNVDAVVSDNVRGGYLATRHLLQLGHRRIAVLSNVGAVSLSDRITGYEQALAEFGVPLDSGLVFSADTGGYDAAYELTGRIVTHEPDVTAAFCLRDDSAWGCIQRLADMGIDVPGAISVVGYDDNEDICSRIRPRLTTIRQLRREMGERAAALLVERMSNGADCEPEIVSLPVELIVRESTSGVRRLVDVHGEGIPA